MAEDHPEQVNFIRSWARLIRSKLAWPDWNAGLAIIVGAVIALALSPGGRIAYYLELAFYQELRPDWHWMPSWLPWWRIMLLITALGLILALLVIKRRADDRKADLIRLIRSFDRRLVVIAVNISLNSHKRCNIECVAEFFITSKSYKPPSTIFLRTIVDGQQHSLVHNPKTGLYEGGADANCFDEAIKREMRISEIRPGPHFFTALISARDGTDIVGTDESGSLPIIAYYDTDAFSDYKAPQA